MKILIDVLHPKHVHFFRPLITRWSEQGATVSILTRDKDITHQLLDLYEIPYTCLSKQQKGSRLVVELVERWWQMGKRLREFRPDIALSVAGVSTALPSRCLGIPNILFTDTEVATVSNRLSFPFADRILTPEWYRGDMGRRHFRYRGFHEWSYLHPSEFIPDPELVRAEGINPDEPYALMRLVRWDAAHDQGETGLSAAGAITLVQQLASRMRVYLSSEAPAPPALRPYLSRFRIDRIHHIIAHARMFIGESPSMGTEAALLGVPSVIISSWAGRCGNMQVLEREFELMQVYQRSNDFIAAALYLADHPPLPEENEAKRAVLVRDLDFVPGVVDHHIKALIG